MERWNGSLVGCDPTSAGRTFDGTSRLRQSPYYLPITPIAEPNIDATKKGGKVSTETAFATSVDVNKSSSRSVRLVALNGAPVAAAKFPRKPTTPSMTLGIPKLESQYAKSTSSMKPSARAHQLAEVRLQVERMLAQERFLEAEQHLAEEKAIRDRKRKLEEQKLELKERYEKRLLELKEAMLHIEDHSDCESLVRTDLAQKWSKDQDERNETEFPLVKKESESVMDMGARLSRHSQRQSAVNQNSIDAPEARTTENEEVGVISPLWPVPTSLPKSAHQLPNVADEDKFNVNKFTMKRDLPETVYFSSRSEVLTTAQNVLSYVSPMKLDINNSDSEDRLILHGKADIAEGAYDSTSIFHLPKCLGEVMWMPSELTPSVIKNQYGLPVLRSRCTAVLPLCNNLIAAKYEVKGQDNELPALSTAAFGMQLVGFKRVCVRQMYQKSYGCSPILPNNAKEVVIFKIMEFVPERGKRGKRRYILPYHACPNNEEIIYGIWNDKRLRQNSRKSVLEISEWTNRCKARLSSLGKWITQSTTSQRHPSCQQIVDDDPAEWIRWRISMTSGLKIVDQFREVGDDVMSTSARGTGPPLERRNEQLENKSNTIKKQSSKQSGQIISVSLFNIDKKQELAKQGNSILTRQVEQAYVTADRIRKDKKVVECKVNQVTESIAGEENQRVSEESRQINELKADIKMLQDGLRSQWFKPDHYDRRRLRQATDELRRMMLENTLLAQQLNEIQDKLVDTHETNKKQEQDLNTPTKNYTLLKSICSITVIGLEDLLEKGTKLYKKGDEKIDGLFRHSKEANTKINELRYKLLEEVSERAESIYDSSVLIRFEMRYLVSRSEQVLQLLRESKVQKELGISKFRIRIRIEKVQSPEKRVDQPAERSSELSCNYCQDGSMLKSSLDSDMRAHSTVELKECRAGFPNFRSLQKHHDKYRSYETDEKNDLVDKCYLCSTLLNRRQTLLLQYVHCDEEVVECNSCSQLFSNAKNLASHMCPAEGKLHHLTSNSSASFSGSGWNSASSDAKGINGDFVILKSVLILKGKSAIAVDDDDDYHRMDPTASQEYNADPLLGPGNEDDIELELDYEEDSNQTRKSSFEYTICSKLFAKEDVLDRHIKLHPVSRGGGCYGNTGPAVVEWVR